MDRRSLPNELIEAILRQVDMQTVLLAQRVCRQWALCIRASSPMQQILFFQPAPANRPRQQNPLLASKFPYWFPADDTKSCAIAFGAGDMQDFLESSDIYRRPEASWRRMLVQQPPIMALGWVERSVSPSNVIDLHRWEIPLQALGGLQMNILYDLVVNTSEVAPEYFYFRVLWSQSKTLSSSFASLRSDPCPSFNSDRIDGPLRHAMQGADVVLDMWYTSQMKNHLWKGWSKDTWTWELVRGLKLAMDDFDIDLVRCMREPKEVKSWTLAEELSDYAREVGPVDHAMPLPDEDDPDL
ncbi:hypothetical protein DTO013E5_8363 [Penicillium roqueforti]|uniref:F-box domain, cyclin-like n=1 Tax=Penicillium roqueforti (strain FM164) TaxID=1365484 RepID=W6QKF8_PENRF|nr:hypothetical protein CBS147354_9498 [Penicillium roqueforti]CDM37273.1 F-box domain, cyclin-like [Penicillium roqueforti FM164]KAI2740884.1 hypothetical protein DTO013F2_8989 [Penicillium roqueforti]KAI2743437.1 hypothetical protein DTO012A1_3351 [Penicillium roqueforti]KAI2767117.1 hypothetical protein DTO012A8_7666 [Penicillium roqueforti]